MPCASTRATILAPDHDGRGPLGHSHDMSDLFVHRGSSDWIGERGRPLTRDVRARRAVGGAGVPGGGRRRVGRGDEHGVVSGDRAGDVGQAGLIDGTGDRVGAGGRRADDHERPGRLHGEHGEPETLVERIGALIAGHERRGVGRRRVPGGRAGEPELPDVAGQGGLRDREASPPQQARSSSCERTGWSRTSRRISVRRRRAPPGWVFMKTNINSSRAWVSSDGGRGAAAQRDPSAADEWPPGFLTGRSPSRHHERDHGAGGHRQEHEPELGRRRHAGEAAGQPGAAAGGSGASEAPRAPPPSPDRRAVGPDRPACPRRTRTEAGRAKAAALCAMQGLRQHVGRAPRHRAEQLGLRRSEPDQVVPSVLGRPEHDVQLRTGQADRPACWSRPTGRVGVSLSMATAPAMARREQVARGRA